ncbi:MAG: hypothetical protein N2C14_01320, partial [Planctomycetales bacterium]
MNRPFCVAVVLIFFSLALSARAQQAPPNAPADILQPATVEIVNVKDIHKVPTPLIDAEFIKGMPENLPPFLKDGMYHSRIRRATDIRNGVVEFKVTRPGILFLYVSFEAGGDRSGGWFEERVTKDDLLKAGWQYLGVARWRTSYHLLKKSVSKGESYRIRTSKYATPLLVVLSPNVKQPAAAPTIPAAGPQSRPPRDAPPLGSPKAPTKQLAPVPAQQALKAAEKLVKEIFAKDYSGADSTSDRLNLAKNLFSQGKATQDDHAGRYVLFREARSFAVQAGSVDFAREVTDAMTSSFKMDAIGEKVAALIALGAAAKFTSQREAVAKQALAVMDAAMAREEFDLAEQLGTTAMDVAQKSRKSAIMKAVSAKVAAVREQAQKFAVVKKAMETLKTNA